jgi:predicted lipoprotein with Yx(FWY)xxD motif
MERMTAWPTSRSVVLAALTGLLLAGCAGTMPAAPAHKIVDTPMGKVLATNRGMTLYTFSGDNAPGVSACSDRCAVNSPPLIALDDAQPSGRWTIVQRSDGLKQWAYNGKPLYGWHDDKRLGDTLGDGQGNGAWKAARP